jgi:hypothetical protein
MKKNTQSDEKMQEIEKSFWEEAEKYPGAAFSREDLASFLGISVGYLANLDSQGKGPDGGYHSGRKKMYLKKPAIRWGIQRVEV